MISKEEFINLINDFQNFDKKVSEVSDVLQVNFFESEICTYGFDMFTSYLKLLFNQDAVDDINWWLYDRDPDNPEPQMWQKIDDKKVAISTHTLDDLWNIVKDNRK